MMKRLLSILSSTAFAVVIISVIAAVSMLGTVIPQKESPDVYLKLYGEIFSGIFLSLGLFDLYGSLFFKALLILAGVSLLSCSYKRLVLALQGKLNFYLWGSFIAHLSILMIFLGAVYGSAAGFSNFAVIEKGSSFFSAPGNFFVRLNDFNAKFDRGGRPLEFSSDLSVVENGAEKIRKIIYVNNPLEYKGIKFYQSSFGLRGELEIGARGGKVERIPIAQESCAVYAATGQMFHVQEIFPDAFALHGISREVYEPIAPLAYLIAHDDRSSEDVGWLIKGKTVDWKNYRLKLADVREYTGLQVRRDPGVPAVFLGFALLMVGVGMMLYKFYDH